ncbi:hypothetical protein BC939DRAFT_131168 [Gamsiella multidivaricata]|uniref:uncharacterized protein n=1 Tax=Gamsiella multidivaricata TaxID=101098 RepID=UPI00222122D3|nr:uncharacterized protein BC939DRAFT_131168 [Gamsiella multidivaricata]KAI7825143.1 hypothetical protein BC939DRAFT_131168 [Gamsiella multidivaricata]
MDKNQRKHDLVESQSGFEINVREQPSTKKKRTLSFRRPLPRLSSPSSFSNSNSETGAGTKGCSIAASGSTSIPTTSAIPTILPRTGTTAEDTQSGQQDTTQGTRSAGTVGAITESASETRITSPKSSELWDSPPLPDYEDQKERCLQEGIDSEVEGGSVAIRTGAAEINFSSTDIKITRFIQEAEEADDDPGRRYAGSAALEAVHCQESTEEEAIVETGQPSESLTNPAHDPDCDEDEGEGVDRGEFPNDDEIQDWGMDGFQNDFGPYPTVDPVLENACPICGLDLSKLNTMTPNAHVNRCLDGVASDPVPAVLAPESEATGQTSLGNQLTSIIGTIRSAVTNFQPRLGSSTSTPAPKPSTSISKPINKWQSKRKAPRPCPFYKKMPSKSKGPA